MIMMLTYHILKIPYETDATTPPPLGQALVELSCHITGGRGETALELVFLGSETTGQGVECYLTLRSRAPSPLVLEALSAEAEAQFTARGYVYEQAALPAMSNGVCWGICKQALPFADGFSPRVSFRLPVAKELRLGQVLEGLDGSGCAFVVQLLPEGYSPAQRTRILELSAEECHYMPSSHLPRPPMSERETLSRSDWSDYRTQVHGPAAWVNLMVLGPGASALRIAGRVQGSLRDRLGQSLPTQLIDLGEAREALRDSDGPWKLQSALARLCPGPESELLRKPTAQEAGQFLTLPTVGESYSGMTGNPFSLLCRQELLPSKFTVPCRDTVHFGSLHDGRPFFYPLPAMKRHVCIYGQNGSGKTFFLRHLISQLHQAEVDVLIIDPVKREFRPMLRELPDLKVFTANAAPSPFLLNPFLPPAGMPLGAYKGYLADIFQAVFQMESPLPALFSRCIDDCYKLHGWRDDSRLDDEGVEIFTMYDFAAVFQQTIRSSNYSAEVKGNLMSGGVYRLMSLISRCPAVFETVRSVPVEDLMRGGAILELDSLEGEQKLIVTFVTLIGVLGHLRSRKERRQCALVLDEAHLLLSHTDGGEDKAAALLRQLVMDCISELRALGCGVILADQSPSRLGGTILSGADMSILFRLKGEEAVIAAKALALTTDEARLLPLLGSGEAVAKSGELQLQSALGFTVPRLEQAELLEDEAVRAAMADYHALHARDFRPFPACAENPFCRFGCCASIRQQAAVEAAKMAANYANRFTDYRGVGVALQEGEQFMEDSPRGRHLHTCTGIQLAQRLRVERDVDVKMTNWLKRLGREAGYE